MQFLTKEDFRILRQIVREELEASRTRSMLQLDKRWVKSWQVMEMLGISAKTLQKMRREGVLPYKQMGRLMFYDVEQIEALMSRTQGSINSK